MRKCKNEENMKKLTLLTLTLLLALVSCVQPTNQRADYSSDSWGSSGDSSSDSDWSWDDSDDDDDSDTDDTTTGDGYGDGTEDGVADAGQTQDYYTIEGITLHGNSRVSSSSDVRWSTTSLGDGQLILYTDSRLHIRVRPRGAPSQGTSDSYGETCAMEKMDYSKLKIKLCIRSESGTCSYRTVTFGNIAVDQVSKVKEFSGSYIPNTTGPIVIDVVDVEWDGTCQYYLNNGYSEDDEAVSSYCPMARVWNNDCVVFDLQFSTDYTKDFPETAPRL